MRKLTFLAGCTVALLLAVQVGCQEDKKKPMVTAQYEVHYLASVDTRTRAGSLGTDLGKYDLYGFCGAVGGDDMVLNVQVSDPTSVGTTPNWELAFRGVQWSEGSTSSVTCEHVEFWDEQVGSEHIPCGGGDAGTCQITVSRSEDIKHTVQFWFSCNDFDTNVSTGGVPNRMTVLSGALQVENCSGF
jgi:hypothetical protein